MPNIMYDGMVVTFSDTKKTYIWVEAAQGLMATGYIYPEWYDDIQGQNYAGKRYNFVLFDKVCKIDLVFTISSDAGLLVPKSKLPFHILNDMDSVTVTMKSSSSAFRQIEFPDYVEATAAGLLIVLDPKPSINEVFKITIL
jgi:hypothetical protein